MSLTPSQVSANIIAKLNVIDPTLSLEVGTPERAICDAVGEAISESYVDNYLIGSILDIDTLTGIELDDYVGIFGFGRLQGNMATGIVTFSLAAPAVTEMDILVGTQVYVPATTTQQATNFATTQAGGISVGQLSVDIPIQCVQAGIIGNVGSNEITGFGTSIGITSVTNSSPCTGGTDPETDSELVLRFKNTLLRNIAGTPDWYIALCQQYQGVTQANVIGPIALYEDQLQVASSTATSSIIGSQYTWPQSDFLSVNLGQVNEQVFTPGVDYIMVTSNPPVINVLNPTNIPNGTIVTLQFEYTPSASRNQILNGVTNKVDVFFNGSSAVQVTESTVVSSQTFNTTVGSPYNTSNFSPTPTSGHQFQQLGNVPVLIPPATITIGVTTYTLGTNYRLVQDITANQGSNREVSGLEWITTAPTPGSAMTMVYTYNMLPEILQSLMYHSRQITTDVLMHQCSFYYFLFNIVIVYTQGQTPTNVNAAIETAIQAWLGSLTFGTFIQASDVIQVVHNVTGVDNIRIADTTDNPTNYGIQSMSADGNTILTTYTSDFRIPDNFLPAFSGLNVYSRGPNTFRSSLLYS